MKEQYSYCTDTEALALSEHLGEYGLELAEERSSQDLGELLQFFAEIFKRLAKHATTGGTGVLEIRVPDA